MRAGPPVLIAILVLLPLGPADAQTAEQVHASYDVYALGVPVAALQAGFALGPRDYRIDLAYHTTGLIGAMFSGHQTTSVQGAWQGDRPEPLRFAGDGYWRGEARQFVIDYQDGNPTIRRLIPPNDEEREPVPAALQDGSIDTLSAIAMLLRRVAHTGKCESRALTFDGRRAAEIVARTAGQELLEPTSRSSFTGYALRCDFEGHMVAGFMRDADQAALRRPQHGSAWLARIAPGAPLVPVRISFETRWFGPATMYLTGMPSGPETPR